MKCIAAKTQNHIVFGSGGDTYKKIKVVGKACREIQRHIQENSKLTKEDKNWLMPLIRYFGAKTLQINNPNAPEQIISKDCRLSIKRINAGNGIQQLKNAMVAMLSATMYKPKIVALGNVTYFVHNKQIAKMLRHDYDENSLRPIVRYLNRNRVFDISENTSCGLVLNTKRGIVKTCGADENKDMSERVWITDIMRVGELQKRKRPETWTKALNTVARYYYNQYDNFQLYINHPLLYRVGGQEEGIPHIFMLDNLQPDKEWFNNKRLEFHGLALKEFSLAIIDGLTKKTSAKGQKTHGYENAGVIPETVLYAMDNLSKYFKAIDYPSAPSAGNWEEIPLEGGLTSDTEAIRSGLQAFRDFLYSPKYDKFEEMQKIRHRIQDNHRPLTKDELDKLIEAGLTRVRHTYLEEAPGIRPHDSSLVFVTTSDVKLSDNPLEDIKKHVKILTSLEKNLVRKNGMIRYAPFDFKLQDGSIAVSPDSYLNLNYFIAVDKNGKINLEWKKILDQYASKDCSEPKLFAARAKLATQNKEAQWFMVSEMSTGYGKQIEKLLKFVKEQKRGLSLSEMRLLKNLEQKQNEYLNRALARVSSETPNKDWQFKANGMAVPPTTISEAHQYVINLNGDKKMLQGVNSPLAWAHASLYKALHQKAIVIKMLAE